MKTLRELPNSAKETIKSLDGDTVLVARLKELGFVRGEEVTVTGRAPFGEPLLVEVRGAVVALRKEEAECVKI